MADVGNPWLDAGIVTFSTLHYRSDRAYWSEWFPADFITESFPGQFRNWFYSLLVMAAALENTPPARAILGYATLLDQNGEEVHKSKGNSIPLCSAGAFAGPAPSLGPFATHPPGQSPPFPRLPTNS